MQNLSVKVPDELRERLEQEAKRLESTPSEITRRALESYFTTPATPVTPDTRRQNLELVIYELALTRAVVLRVLDGLAGEVSDTLIDAARQDAEAYVKEQRRS